MTAFVSVSKAEVDRSGKRDGAADVLVKLRAEGCEAVFEKWKETGLGE